MVTYSQLGNKGRLGNQLFQIASTIGIATENSQPFAFPNWEYNKYFQAKLSQTDELPEKIVVERYINYGSIILDSPEEDYDLNGYFQSEKYFKSHERDIRDLFKPSDIIKNRIEKNYKDIAANAEEYTSMHVRRGDYLALKSLYEPLEKKYYLKCLEKCEAKKVLVFSDDIEHCKRTFDSSIFYEFEYVEEREHDAYEISTSFGGEENARKFREEDVTELILMSLCKNNIIANSSFGWWAAWLNENERKKVFAPQKWYTDSHLSRISYPEDNWNHLDDMYPESWIRI